MLFSKQQIKEMTKLFEVTKLQLQKEIQDHQQRYNEFVAKHESEKQEDTRTILFQNKKYPATADAPGTVKSDAKADDGNTRERSDFTTTSARANKTLRRTN